MFRYIHKGVFGELLPFEGVPRITTQPVVFPIGTELGQRLDVGIVCIQVADVARLLLVIVLTHQLIVVLGITVTAHANDIPHPTLDQMLDCRVCEEVHPRLRLLQDRFTRHLGSRLIQLPMHLEGHLFDTGPAPALKQTAPD